MGRLIDVDILKGVFDPDTWQGETLRTAIDNSPTAYDVDKVVEKLENKLNELPYITADVNIGYQNAIKEAIATVKGAVKDE